MPQKSSNSGDTLKLMIPSYSRKAISGQNNYLGMVTSHKMMETEMGYRGSKSKYNGNVQKLFCKRATSRRWLVQHLKYIKNIVINAEFKVYSNGL